MKCTTSIVAAVAGGTAICCALPASTADTAVRAGPPITVTATRIDEAALLDPIAGRVISARDIERSRASTLTELLHALPEIGRRELPSSPNPQVDLRAFGIFGEHNALVLLDGMRVRESELLTVNWSAIPLASIDRIEILPASGAILHGGGGTGGVINIITKPPERNSRSAYVGAGAGSYDTREARAGGSAAGDTMALRVHGSHYETDNYRDNNRVRIDSAQADVRWFGDGRSLAVKLGTDDQRHGLPGVLSEAQIGVNRRQAASAFDFAEQRGAYLNVSATTELATGELKTDFGYRERDTASSFRVGTPLRNNVDTHVRVWTLAPQLRLRPQFGEWADTLIAGAELTDWVFDANAQPVIVGRPHSTQRSTAVYAQYAMNFATQTTVSTGARAERVRYEITDLANPAANGARQHTLYAWDLSVRQALTPSERVYGRGGSSFRPPNVSDNYNPFFAQVTLLEPQIATEAEIGIERHAGTLRYRASVYHADLRNELFFDPLTLGNRNRPPTRRQALHLESRWHAHPALELYASFIYANAHFRDGVIRGVSIAGNRVPLTPRRTANAGLAWSVSERARANFDLRYTGSSPLDADEANISGREIPAYTVADFRIAARSGGWLLSAGVRNLIGKKYLSYAVFTGRPTYSAFPAAERSAFVSAQYAFR